MEHADLAVRVEDVQAVIVETLGLTGEAASLTADTALLGGMSEFDSLAVMELLAALEARFGIAFEDDDIDAEAFATVGTLTRLVEEKLG